MAGTPSGNHVLGMDEVICKSEWPSKNTTEGSMAPALSPIFFASAGGGMAPGQEMHVEFSIGKPRPSMNQVKSTCCCSVNKCHLPWHGKPEPTEGEITQRSRDPDHVLHLLVVLRK
ncbi:hypothetical protein C2845_PM16G00420 [Panicum miliaceum]|uniref:Uncharacterized protein n=1 Tax=Panicum miliaceum TaxID=4540 RepID=A0A3L6Q1C2_PANMI|nr:hypothetical protein C2845_PM16G00420 [Panicum miliaceum]